MNWYVYYETIHSYGGIAPVFLDLRHWTFTPVKKKALGDCSIEGWVDTGAGLDVSEKRKFSCPCRNSNPG
jgi:hypothetical protein